MKAALQASLAGRSLTEILLYIDGELSVDDLARTLAEHHRLDFIDLDVFAVDPRATALVEPDIARRFGAVPIAQLGWAPSWSRCTTPTGSTASESARLTDRVIQPAVASRQQIEALIATLRRGGKPPARTPAPAPVVPEPPAAHIPTHEPHLRSVPTPEVNISSREPDFRSAPPAPEPPPRHDDQPAHDSRIDDLRERAETAERRRHESDERARAAEERAREAEELDTPCGGPRSGCRGARAGGRGACRRRGSTRRRDVLGRRRGERDPARLVRACELLEDEAQMAVRSSRSCARRSTPSATSARSSSRSFASRRRRRRCWG